MNKILLVGGGGHCQSVLDSLLDYSIYDEIAIIDRSECVGKKIFDIEIIGTDDELEDFIKKGFTYAFITLGSIGNPQKRIQLYNKILSIGYEIPNVIDKNSVIGRNVILNKGIYVGKTSVINSGSYIGNGAIINTGAVIEHNCNIGDFVHIAPRATICGMTQVGNNVHVGANSVIIQGLEIGSNSIIGAGSVVVKNIDSNKIIMGNPAK